jgi:hypothetical protein
MPKIAIVVNAVSASSIPPFRLTKIVKRARVAAGENIPNAFAVLSSVFEIGIEP